MTREELLEENEKLKIELANTKLELNNLKRVMLEKKREYTREKNIPASTFRGWLTREIEIRFGELNLEEVSPNKTTPSKTSTVFITDKIRIELKEGYDKNLLKSLMGVLLNNDKWFITKCR